MPRRGRGGGMNQSMTGQQTATHNPETVRPFESGGSEQPAPPPPPTQGVDGAGSPSPQQAGAPGAGGELESALQAAQQSAPPEEGALNAPGSGGDMLSKGEGLLPEDPYLSLRALYSVYPHPDVLELINSGYDARVER